MLYSIYTLELYDEWFETQTEKSQLQIDKRLEKIEQEGLLVILEILVMV